MEQPLTCGQGLAQNSTLEAKLSDLMAARAENLEQHMKALDLSDENANLEYDAYSRLAREHRMAAAVLQAMAEHMASYRELPMGKHDPKVMTSEALRLVFEKVIEREQDVLNYLQGRLAEDEEILTRARDL